MNELRSIGLYVVGAVVLIGLTTLFQVKPDSDLAASFVITATPPPTIIPTATPLPPTRVRITAGPEGCITTRWGGHEGYRPNAPLTTNLVLSDASGERLTVRGTVHASDCKTPLAGVLLEVWHINPDGNHKSPRLRARLWTDSQGRYTFTTIKPPRLFENNHYVPSKIHFRVSYPGAPTLATELFFEGDSFLRSVSTAQLRLARPLTVEEGPDGPVLSTTFDISLAVNPPAGG